VDQVCVATRPGTMHISGPVMNRQPSSFEEG
jgi:hypothetical protein